MSNQEITLEELLKFASEQQEVLKNNYNRHEQDFVALSSLAKLTEELGEMSNEVLHALKLQRASKLKTDNKEDLAAEVADVLICVLLVANSLNIDVRPALRQKIDKIVARRGVDD